MCLSMMLVHGYDGFCFFSFIVILRWHQITIVCVVTHETMMQPIIFSDAVHSQFV